MTSFSNLLSSISDPTRAPQAKPSSARPTSSTQTAQTTNTTPSRFQLTSSNAAAGIKRKSEEPASQSSAKSVKLEGAAGRTSAPGSRFQLTAKTKSGERPTPQTQSRRPTSSTGTSQNINRPISKQAPRPVAPSTQNQTRAPQNGVAKPPVKKGGFASILEKAKLAQEASKQALAGGIQNKAVEKMTRKERQRMREEEQAAKKKGGRKGPIGGQADRSRSGTPSGVKPAAAAVQKKTPAPLGYKGTMANRPSAGPTYGGTMRAGGVGAGAPKPKQKGAPQDKYGGYASWSDLSDAEEEDEGDYDSYESDDMEGGFDDLEAEEQAALRHARKEDQEAAEEEERLRREKMTRKQKLLELSKNAAAKKRY